MVSKAHYSNQAELASAIRAARGDIVADLVIKGARFLDVFGGEFVAGDVAVYKDRIVGTCDHYSGREEVDATKLYVIPGLIDAHVHIESSMMTPARFQEAVLPMGTTSVIWDPHEIANVRGLEGLQWALEASEGLLLDFFIMLSSCVPSTTPGLGLETSSAALGTQDLIGLRSHPRVLGLAEMMNYPGLLSGDPEVLSKIVAFQASRLDGHCPGLTGRDLNAYGTAGIHSCHESTTQEEAREKLRKGIRVLIREGSCAKDADALLPLLDAYTSAILGLCSDDRNPLDIAQEGHINFIVEKALRAGHDPENIFRAASLGPALAYDLADRGALAPGYLADFCLVRPKVEGDWSWGYYVEAVYKRGQRVDAAQLAAFAAASHDRLPGQNMHLDPVTEADLVVIASPGVPQSVRVIGVLEGKLLTEMRTARMVAVNGEIGSDPQQDVLKIAVFERHHATGRRGIGFAQGFGLRQGAIATSINHDSHNAIVVGASDETMVQALNRLIEIDGGIVVVTGDGGVEELYLPIGGLMCDDPPAEIADALAQLKLLTQEMGCTLREPFLQLSFLALPVIPALKITDRGLVDVDAFKLVPVVEEA